MSERTPQKDHIIDRVMKKVDPDSEFSIEEYAKFHGANFNEVGFPDFSLALKKIIASGKAVLGLFTGREETK